MIQLADHIIQPNWPAPAKVQAIQTTRLGGVSLPPYDSLNVGDHVQDNPQHVVRNRQSLSQWLPSEPVWLKQTHSVHVINAAKSRCIENADASYTNKANVVCAVMTADCLPVLLCDQAGTTVAAIHAGWRGLCDGIIESTVKALGVETSQLMAWLGPAIGPDAFEVGDEVREQFIAHDAQAASAFTAKQDKWLGDLYLLAKQRLNNVGVQAIYGEVNCTFSNPAQFFSYRRDGETGRMATLIWLKNP